MDFLPYYLLFTALLAAAAMGTTGHGIRNLLYWIALAGLFAFSAFRYEVGCDWSGYLDNFQLFAGKGYQDVLALREPAHWALIVLIRKSGLPYHTINIVTSALFFIGLHALARRQPNPLGFLVLAFPILIINMPMSAIRQGAAIGFICLAYTAFLDRRLMRFVLFVIGGALFHSSALFFLLLVPFVRGSYSIKNIALSFILAAPGAALVLIIGAIEVAASRYIGTGIDAAGAVFRLGLLSLTGLFFLMSLRKRWRQKFPHDYKLVRIGASMMLAAFSLFFISSVIGDRFGYYLVPLQLIIFARLPRLYDTKYEKLIMAVSPYMVLGVTFLVWTQSSTLFRQCYLPYQIRF